MDQGITRAPDSGKLVQSKPRIGDVTICLECGEWAEFGPDDTLLKITDEGKLESLTHNKDAMMARMMVRAVKSAKSTEETNAYGEQIKQMAKAVRDWTRENPSRCPAIQRNSTSRVGIIATLSDAIEHKFVSVNDDAIKMLQDVGWLDDEERMPTVFMAEAAIELAFKDSVDKD